MRSGFVNKNHKGETAPGIGSPQGMYFPYIQSFSRLKFCLFPITPYPFETYVPQPHLLIEFVEIQYGRFFQHSLG